MRAATSLLAYGCRRMPITTPEGETSIDGVAQGNAADTLRLGAGMGAGLWPGGDVVLNAESVVAKPESEPYAWGVRLTLRQFW